MTAPRTIEAILFDLDGTLLDTGALILDSHRYATRTVLGRVIPDEVLSSTIGQPLLTQMKLWADSPAQAEELCRVYREYNEARHDEAVSAFPGIPEVLRALHEAKVPLGVVTSKMHRLAWHGLELFGLDACMELLVGADDWHEHKPAPGPVLRACELMGVAPEACLYVGDSPFDLQAGREAGCLTAAVTWGVFDLAALAPEQPDFTLHEARELLAIPGVL